MTTTKKTSSFAFPHPTLTSIEGKPTAKTIASLLRQVYDNAASVESTRGGGSNGHLAVIMPNADYTALTGGTAFDVPTHPGAAPAIPAGATGPQITQLNHAYDRALDEHRTYTRVQLELKQQILAAVETPYLSDLEHHLTGYKTVSPLQMITHLQTEYGTVTQDQIEENRAELLLPWSPDAPIETLWECIRKTRQFAQHQAGEAISDDATMRLTIKMFKSVNIFSDYIRTWREKEEAAKTFVNFKTHFKQAHKTHKETRTAEQAGFSGATTSHSAPACTSTSEPVHVLTNNNIKMYYCWSHGLGKNSRHTSATCNRKKEGHQDTATADNMMGGCDRIMQGGRRATQGNDK